MATIDQTALGVVGVVDAVTERLRGAILGGDLRSGAIVTEARVSADYGVARPSAKAAIEQLVAAGLLHRTAHRSARVTLIDADTASDVYRTRSRLEGAVVRELARARAVPDAAVFANAEFDLLPESADPRIVNPDLRFHTALVNAVSSERTSRMYRAVLDEVRLCMAQVQSRRLVDAATIRAQHADILAAIADGDEGKAAQLLRAHLAGAEERLVEDLRAAAARAE